MKSIIVLVCFLWVAAAINIDVQRGEEFRAFVGKYKKAYRHSPEEYAYRLQVFLRNLDFIEEFNKQGNSYKVGITQFADLTTEEYAKGFWNMDYSHNVYDNSSYAAPPASVDWRTSKDPVVVGPVRDMEQCASPAAISVVDSVAAEYAAQHQADFFSFNITNVNNCDGQKCNGGTTDNVWSYVKKFGLQYYIDSCPTGPGVGICISGTTCVASGNEEALQNAVATKGPISISIDASNPSFQMYTSGIYNEPKCSSTKLNFALLLVGYGSQNGQDYWIARNEWGSSWGMNGDILLARNKNNQCGVATSACYATTVQNCMCVL